MVSTEIFRRQIEEMVHKLLELARDSCYNKIADHCQFILTDIPVSGESFREQQRLLMKQNAQKVPVTLDELMPALNKLYHDLYDINLYIYKATPAATIIDIRYFRKSLLDAGCRQTGENCAPMLHCKIALPPGLLDKDKRFDINWEHHTIINSLKRTGLRISFWFVSFRRSLRKR